MKSLYADIYLEGTGLRSVALGTTVHELEDQGYELLNIAGTSMGALVGALMVVGYSGKEIDDILQDFNFDSYLDEDGYVDKKKFVFWFEKLLKGKITIEEERPIAFKDIIISGEKTNLMYNPKYERKYRLHIFASDISRGKNIIIPEDMADYGMNPEEVSIAEAVYMSMSVPFLFKPTILNTKQDNKKCILCDGEILSDYPIYIFDVNSMPAWPTIGVKVLKKAGEVDASDALEREYALNILDAVQQTKNLCYTNRANLLRTIKIEIDNIESKETSISEDKRRAITLEVKNSVNEFLSTWEENYEKYIDERRNTIRQRILGIQNKYI